MLVSEYLLTRNRQVSITTGNPRPVLNPPSVVEDNNQSFADVLNEAIAAKSGVEFSGHALKRISSRSIDVMENQRLERLSKGVELAAEKGSKEALVLVDEAAFIVSVKNNKVITTMSKADMLGNVFTNIDSTIII